MILGEVKARPKDIISFSLDYISKSKVQTSNPSSSPISLDTPARPADSSALSSYTLHFFLKGLSKILAVAPSIDGNPCMSPSSPCSARHATLLQSFLEAQDSRSSCFQTETAQKSEEQIEKTFHIHWKIEPTTP